MNTNLSEPKRSLPDWLSTLLSCPPKTGEGVHQWLFNTARHLHVHHSEEDMFRLFRTITEGNRCGRLVHDREIRDAVLNSKNCAYQIEEEVATTHKAKPKWPEVKRALRAQVIPKHGGLEELREQSAIAVNPEAGTDHNDAEDIVDLLFPGNPLLCCGKSSSQFATRPRETWRGKLHRMQLIVPSPMTARYGKRKSDGEESEHTLDNTGPQRFLICEFDKGNLDDHASILLHLTKVAPLALVVFSGSKSLHGWFYVEGDEDQAKRFFTYAVKLGADPATWTRSQFVRMPEGLRENGNRQVVHFFDPFVTMATKGGAK